MENGTPDLRGRFIMGKKPEDLLGKKGGSDIKLIKTENLPHHIHGVNIGGFTCGSENRYSNDTTFRETNCPEFQENSAKSNIHLSGIVPLDADISTSSKIKRGTYLIRLPGNENLFLTLYDKNEDHGLRECSKNDIFYDSLRNETISLYRIPQYDGPNPNRYGKYYFRQGGKSPECQLQSSERIWENFLISRRRERFASRLTQTFWVEPKDDDTYNIGLGTNHKARNGYDTFRETRMVVLFS